MNIQSANSNEEVDYANPHEGALSAESKSGSMINAQSKPKEELRPFSVQIGALPSSPQLFHENRKTTPSGADFLNPNYTFRTFVPGKNNDFAHAASYAVAENPGAKYNPLFICGPSGMGKTHLLNAVGNEIRQKFPSQRIKYLSADRFFNEYISAIRTKEMDKFILRYRDNCDVILMDDIHVLGKSESVQEEFFNTLNSLFERGCQVVVSSDRFPKDIPGLLDRIRTRLEWGLIADIQMPDLETRVVILRYKAEALGINLPDEVVNYIARISKRSIRELEGNLNKVKMYTELQGLSITIDHAKQILAAHSTESTTLTMEDIQKLCAQHFNIRVSDLKSSTRVKPIVTARQIAMTLCKKYLGKSYMDIGRAHGGKDHTTVMNAVQRIEEQLLTNADLKRDLEDIETRIHNLTGL
jgi:chromosomal replication initiator protein